MKPWKNIFTLIEILTVIALMLILGGIAAGVIGLVNRKNAEIRTKATLQALELALGQYKSDTGCVYAPSGIITLATPGLLRIPAGIPSDLNGTLLKYLDQKLLNSATAVSGSNRYFIDGWNRPLIYRIPGNFNKTGFDLGSVGPNGKVGEDGVTISVNSSSIPNSIVKDAEKYKVFGQGDDITNFLSKD